MAIVSQQPGAVGANRGDGEVAERSTLLALLQEFNGNIETANLKDGAVAADKLAAALASILGVSTATTTRRAKLSIPAEQVPGGIVYAKLATADEVTVTLPADGFIYVSYKALLKITGTIDGSVNGRAAIFLNGNQLKRGADPAPLVQEASAAGNFTGYQLLRTAPGPSQAAGLQNVNAAGATSWAEELATGQTAPGEWVAIEAAAGTYTVSIQFRNETVARGLSIKNRLLRVKTESFG